MPRPIGSAAAFCAGLLAPAVLALGAVLAGNGGAFAYPLDGPYIHLALAEQILHGHYGLNPGEPASPSSTILYPLLLAALGAGQGTWLWSSLVVCLACNAASGLLLFLVAEEAGIRLRALPRPALFGLGASLALALNLAGLALDGLEHAPHVTLTLASLLGLLRFIRQGRAEWWWLLSILLLPLIRFEAMAAVLADALVLVAWGKWRHGLGVLAAAALLVGGFGLFLVSQGLPFLPQSVLARSMVAGTGAHLAAAGPAGMLRSVYTNLRVNLLAYGGTHILGALMLVLWGAVRAGPARAARLATAGFFAVVGLAQLLAGSLVSVSRYEIYVLALALGALLVVWAAPIDAALRGLRPLGHAALCLSILALGAGYAFRTVDAVKAAWSMHRLDDQAWRFVVEDWRGPVILSRYGRLNWRNPYGAEELPPVGPATAATESARSAAAALVARRGIRLGVLDDAANAALPPGWEAVGWLRPTPGGLVDPTQGLAFHALHPEDRAPILQALRCFRPRLPPGVTLDLVSGGEGGCPPR